MKLNKIVLPLVLPLAVMLMTTGCPHRNNVPVTKLRQPAVTSNPTPPPDLSTKPLNIADATPVATPVSTPIKAPGNYPTADINLDDYIQDRAALAAYTVHFKYDSAVVEDSEQADIASVAQALTDQNLKLLVEGHCDERGTEEYNRSLGERRALALREALAKINVDPTRVKTESFGKDKPVDLGHDESAWTKNRRGEFILLRPKTPAQ
jgi:peptidoglycan-associated lipoprotein